MRGPLNAYTSLEDHSGQQTGTAALPTQRSYRGGMSTGCYRKIEFIQTLMHLIARGTSNTAYSENREYLNSRPFPTERQCADRPTKCQNKDIRKQVKLNSAKQNNR